MVIESVSMAPGLGRGNRVCLLLALFCLAACDSSINKSDTDAAETKMAKAAEFIASKAVLETESLVKQALIGSQFDKSTAPAALAYATDIKRILASKQPVLALENVRDQRAREAQTILLADPRLQRFLYHSQTKEPLRNEVMSIKPTLPSDQVGAAQTCRAGECRRVDIYNFYYNVTITGIIDIVTQRVILINTLPETQPDLSPRLTQLAEAIAKHEPLVQQEVSRYLASVGEDQDPAPVMVSTKTALKNTLCERSQHLCVAPTYVLGRQALWVIVDLTELRVAGVRWTTVSNSDDTNAPPQIITERKLENEYVFKNYCEKVTSISRNGWSFDYHLTSSDGLRIADARYQEKSVFNNAKVVDWHVSYSRSDQFGYSDATGCPIFSSAVVVAYEGPEIDIVFEDGMEVGFAITQDFRQLPWPAACNYRYQERYEFYDDGRYRVAVSNLGRGCGSNGTYRPVLRIDLGDVSGIEQWQGGNWVKQENEAWSPQPPIEKLQQEQYSHRISSSNGDYLMAPSTGNFGDGGRGDNAFIYTTVKHADRDEGDGDLVTLGSCCNSDHRQGPEQFLEPPEALAGQNLILWYVPQIENDGREGQRYCWAETTVVDGVAQTKTWPCTAGPMFVPVSNTGSLQETSRGAP